MAKRSGAKRQTKREKRARNIWCRIDREGREVFEVVYRDSDGRQHRERVIGGITAAKGVRADGEARKARHERVAPQPRLKFGHAAEGWWTAQAAQLAPATRSAYRHALDDHLLPAWADRRMDKLTVSEVAALIGRMQTVEYRRQVEARVARPTRKVTSGYAAWTIRGVLTVAGRIFEYARRHKGWAGVNPVRALDHRERPRNDARERRVLGRDELRRLLDHAAEPHRLLFAFAAGTGVRLGEALAVRWGDLDLTAGTVSITGQLDRPRKDGAGQPQPPKRVALKTQRSKRVVDLPAALVSTLREHQVRSLRSRPSDYVFVSRAGAPFDQGNVRRALAQAVKRAGLDETEGKVTFHSFRHSYASAWIASGGDMVELSRALGHRDPSITASTYSHEFERASRSEERKQRLDGIFGSALATPDRNTGQQTSGGDEAEVVDLQARATGDNRRR